ncbi:MAG: murein L,D-transpeptidase catalytic domain family protein [Bdellovibrio sp.]|jgi:hypothetical protein
MSFFLTVLRPILSLGFFCAFSSGAVFAQGAGTSELATKEIQEKILSQGVPAQALDQLVRYFDQNNGREYRQDIYICDGQEPTNVKPCEEKKRKTSERTVKLAVHSYGVIIDYTKSSLEQRYFLINWKTGEVTKMLATHGKNTGDLYAYRFSNIKDSRQTSLGIYITGETYTGSYGSTLRLYGLQRSNDQAYHRDIVMHGAWYADASFAKSINPKTKLPFGRLGVSWGCPAIAPSLAKRVFPLLKDGAMVYHFHPELEESAQTGREVRGPNLEVPRGP